MRCRRDGFTMIELMLVIVMVAVMMMLAAPKFVVQRDATRVRAAGEQLRAAFSAAQAAAIQRGVTATLRIENKTVIVQSTSPSTGVVTRLLGPLRFDAERATLRSLSGDSTFNYDPRGQLTPLLASMARFELAAGSKKDTICIAPSGLVMPRDCVL